MLSQDSAELEVFGRKTGEFADGPGRDRYQALLGPLAHDPQVLLVEVEV